MALGCESLRTALLKIKHVAVMMEVGTQGRIGKKIWFNRLDCFFSLPSPFKQTPDGHPAGMTISLLRFWQPLIPCSFPSLNKKKRGQIHNYDSKKKTLCALNLQTSTDSTKKECMSASSYVCMCIRQCFDALYCNPGNRGHSGISMCAVITLTAVQGLPWEVEKASFWNGPNP